MKLEKGMNVWLLHPRYGKSDNLSWSAATVTAVGRKYATIQIESGREFKFDVNVWEKEWDNKQRCVETNYPATIHKSKEEYERLLKETQTVEKLLVMFLRGHFKPTYEQAIKIAEIMNVQV